jgi:hypothetical protein
MPRPEGSTATLTMSKVVHVRQTTHLTRHNYTMQQLETAMARMINPNGESDSSRHLKQYGAGVADLTPGKATPGLGTAPGERIQGSQGSCLTRPHRMPNYLSRIPRIGQASASASSEITIEVILCKHCLPAHETQCVTAETHRWGTRRHNGIQWVQGRKRQLETRRNPATYRTTTATTTRPRQCKT